MDWEQLCVRDRGAKIVRFNASGACYLVGMPSSLGPTLKPQMVGGQFGICAFIHHYYTFTRDFLR